MHEAVKNHGPDHAKTNDGYLPIRRAYASRVDVYHSAAFDFAARRWPTACFLPINYQPFLFSLNCKPVMHSYF